MKIYLDYIFIENLLITIITLYQMKNILDVNTSVKRIIIASLISATYIVIMIFLKINFMNYLVCKIILVQIIIYIAFNSKSIKMLIVNSIKFLIINIFNIGTMYFLSNFINVTVNNIIQKIGIYILTFIIVNYIVKYLSNLVKNKQNMEIYDVKMKLFEKTINYKGFLDTGNTVFCYIYNLPVIFASIPKEIKYKELNKLKSLNIIIETINGKQEKIGYLIEELFIKEINEIKKCIVIFVDEKYFSSSRYNMILNKKIL